MNRITVDEQELIDLNRELRRRQRLLAAYRANFIAAQLGVGAGGDGAQLAVEVFECEALGEPT